MFTSIDQRRRLIAGGIYITSVVLFILGISNPIMGSELLMGLKRSEVYLTDSIEYFYENGDWFIGSVILVFTFILPILKYLFLGTQLIPIKFPKHKWVGHVLQIINKWAMLDVYIVALLIMNFKFESTILDNYVMSGTKWFAASILLLMGCSYILSQSTGKLAALQER